MAVAQQDRADGVRGPYSGHCFFLLAMVGARPKVGRIRFSGRVDTQTERLAVRGNLCRHDVVDALSLATEADHTRLRCSSVSDVHACHPFHPTNESGIHHPRKATSVAKLAVNPKPYPGGVSVQQFDLDRCRSIRVNVLEDSLEQRNRWIIVVSIHGGVQVN